VGFGESGSTNLLLMSSCLIGAINGVGASPFQQGLTCLLEFYFPVPPPLPGKGGSGVGEGKGGGGRECTPCHTRFSPGKA